jgi:DNA-binding transcriptional LysR family regulator
MERAIEEGRVDLGITYLPVPTPGLRHQKITSIEMDVFTKKGAFPGLTQRELPFVTPAVPLHETPSRVRGLDGWPDDAYPRKVQFQVELLSSAMELVRLGYAAAYLPVFLVQDYNRMVRESFQFERRRSPFPGRVCQTDVYLVRPEATIENRTHRVIAKAIRSCVNLGSR